MEKKRKGEEDKGIKCLESGQLREQRLGRKGGFTLPFPLRPVSEPFPRILSIDELLQSIRLRQPKVEKKQNKWHDASRSNDLAKRPFALFLMIDRHASCAKTKAHSWRPVDRRGFEWWRS